MNYIKLLFPVFLFSALANCSSESNHTSTSVAELPEAVKGLENLTVYDADSEPLYSTRITEDLVFRETEEVFWRRIGNIAVDQSGRLYMETGGGDYGDSRILVFDKNGKYIQGIGRTGRGPGEFEFIQDIYANNDNLYVFEPYRFHTFNLADLSLTETVTINVNEIPAISELKSRNPSAPFMAINDSTFLTGFTSIYQKIKKGKDYNYYTIFNSKGDIDPNPVLKLTDLEFYSATEDGGIGRPAPFPMPFSTSPQVTVDAEGRIYSNFNDTPLITISDLSGKYSGSIFLKIPAAPLEAEAVYDIEFIQMDINRTNVLKEEGLPDTWPVINSLHTDPENRLWISTITESDSTYTWWVINEEHELLARFETPGNKWSRNAWNPDKSVISGNYLYLLYTLPDFREPTEVIRYKIDFQQK